MSKFTTNDQASHPAVGAPSAGRLTWYSLNGEAYVKTPADAVIPLGPPSGAAGGVLGGTYPNPTFAAGGVANASLADMPANTVKANATAGALAPQDLAVPVNTVLGRVAGNIVAAALATAQVAANAITNAKLAQVPTATLKGRVTAATGDAEDLTATQATSLLNLFTSVLKGLVPASGGGTANFLRADGNWAAPSAVGYVLPFGGRGQSIGRHFFVNGIASGNVAATLNQRTEFVAPSRGTIAAISWNTRSGDATTVFTIKKNGVTVDTIPLTGFQGFDAVLSGTVVLAGDRIAVEYFAGQTPDETNVAVYIV